MKTHLPIILAVALVLVAFAVSYVTSRTLESPQDQLNLEIDAQIETAQRMLDAYEPAGERLLDAVEAAPTTQPIELLPQDQWDKHLNSAAFEDRMRKEVSRVQALARAFDRLSGEARPRRPEPLQDVSQVMQDLEKSQRYIEDALAIAQKAVRMTKGDGDELVRGTSHPVATRLEAILLYHKADLLRRRATVYQAVANAERARLARARRSWRELHTLLIALEPDRPGTRPAERGAETAPAKIAPAETAPAETAAVPAKAPGGPRRGLLPMLSGWVFGKRDADPDAGEDMLSEIPDEAPVASEPAEPERLEVEAGPTLARRLADLRAERQRVASDNSEAKEKSKNLAKEVLALEARLAAAQSAADEAQRRMLALQESALEPADPESLDRFTAEYTAASESYRKASREITMLAGGTVGGSGPDAGEKAPARTAAESAAAPAADQTGPTRGLIPLRQAELRDTQDRDETLQRVVAILDDQITELEGQQKDVTARYDHLRASQAALQKEAIQAARAAIAAALEADRLETEAVELLTGPGRLAAQNAKNAASQRISEAQSQKKPESPNPRLELIAKSRFMVGHAETIAADIEYLQAQILADRVFDLPQHLQMLAALAEMGIRDKEEFLPELPAGQTVPDSAFNAEAARRTLEQAQADAVKAAEAAVELYAQAERDLDRLWVVHAHKAAAYYLLANLHPEPPQAQEFRDKALQAFQRSIQDRLDRPEAEAYKRVIDGLTQVAP